MRDIDAFILIGGKSSRLGTDKAVVELGGKTLAQRAVEVTKVGLSPKRVTLVAGSATQFAIEAIRSDVPFIFDLYENRGPLGGLQAALAYAETQWIFLLACDYPVVSPELIAILADEIGGDIGTVVPEQSDGRIQPLCAFYKVEAAMPVVEQLLELPRVPPPMHEMVEGLNPRIVRFEEYSHLPDAEKLFTNINTVDDLKSLECKL